MAVAEEDWEWGTKTAAGSTADAGRHEQLARKRLADYPEYVGLARRRVWLGEWEDAT